MKEVYEFLKSCGAYYLATVEGDQPRVRPFGTVRTADGPALRLKRCWTIMSKRRSICWTPIPI